MTLLLLSIMSKKTIKMMISIMVVTMGLVVTAWTPIVPMSLSFAVPVHPLPVFQRHYRHLREPQSLLQLRRERLIAFHRKMTNDDTYQNFDNKKKNEDDTGINDRAITASSTLNINTEINTSNNSDGNIQYIGTMDDRIQQFTFIMAFVLLGLGTQCCIHLWYTCGIDFLGPDYMYQIQTHIFPILFGSIFGMVGIGHFVFVENFARIVPPYNCWGGLWKVPAPFHTSMNITYEAYHSYWTGIVECMGGIWLLYSGIMSSSSTASILPATLLFALTIGVTPANLYMFTHNASPGGVIPPLQYPFGHIARFIIQCGLLSNFYIMMHPVQL